MHIFHYFITVFVNPFQDSLIVKTGMVKRSEIPEFHCLCPSNYLLSLVFLQSKGEPVQGLWTRTVRIFAIELGGAFR